MTAAAVKKFVENHMNTLNDKYALKSELPEDVDLSNYYTKSETYTKTEVDNKITEIDLSSCVTTTGPQLIKSTDFNQPVMNLYSSYLGVGDWGSVFKCCTATDMAYQFEIKYGAGMWYLESNGNIGLKFEVDNGLAITRAGGCDVTKDKIITQEALSDQLSSYVTNDGLSSQLNDYVTNDGLTTKLGGYYMKEEADDKFVINDYGNELSFTDTTISLSSGVWRSICYGNGVFVVIGEHKCAWSTDGKTFTEGTISEGLWSSVCCGNGMIVAIDYSGNSTWSEFIYATANSFALKDQTYTKTESDERYTLKTELQQSMTITHLAPIDEELDINSFVIGAPVYMTGKVYIKDWKNDIWNKSSVNDSIDCIPSVKTNGTWKEYLGICTHIDKESKEIKFATHGDYLVKVNDSSTYGIGDTVYIEDHEYNNKIIPVLKILSEDIPLTTKINRMTVGNIK